MGAEGRHREATLWVRWECAPGGPPGTHAGLSVCRSRHPEWQPSPPTHAYLKPPPFHPPQSSALQGFEAASGLKVKTKLVGRRPGDAEAVWAATDTAERELGWKAKLTVKDMCEDQWRWASNNPDGYDTAATAAAR